MASGKKNYFRHSFFARNDMKLKLLRDRVGIGFYFYYFSLLEQCGEASSENLKDIYEFHNSTIRNLWSINLKKSERIAIEMMSVGLLEFKKLENSFLFTIPNFSKYMGRYESKLESNSPNKRKEKERKEKESKLNTEAEKNLPKIESQEVLKKASPLSFLFDHRPDIQTWLNLGNHDTHLILVKERSHHELVELVPKAFDWAAQKNLRAESWLRTFMLNQNTHGYGSNQAKKSKTAPTPNNPTGNPYKAQLDELRRNGEIA